MACVARHGHKKSMPYQELAQKAANTLVVIHNKQMGGGLGHVSLSRMA
jgi:hypothetical protein